MTQAEIRAYYDKNQARFQVPDSFVFQSISFLPPQNPSASQAKEGLKRANDTLVQAKATKTYRRVWAAGGKSIRGRFPREHGRPQSRAQR